jgi:hypothetical protein
MSTAQWRKSTYSGEEGGNCVELSTLVPGRIRDSKNPKAPVLSFSRSELAELIEDVKAGKHDL